MGTTKNQGSGPWMSAADSAAYLRVSQATFRRMVDAGQVPAGRRIGIRVQRWLPVMLDTNTSWPACLAQIQPAPGEVATATPPPPEEAPTAESWT